MRKATTKKLTLKSTTIRDLTSVELVHVPGGYQQTAYVCTAKNSGCHKCDTQLM